VSDEAIIINDEALTEAFIPTMLLHLEGQIRELERFKPTFESIPVAKICLVLLS